MTADTPTNLELAHLVTVHPAVSMCDRVARSTNGSSPQTAQLAQEYRNHILHDAYRELARYREQDLEDNALFREARQQLEFYFPPTEPQEFPAAFRDSWLSYIVATARVVSLTDYLLDNQFSKYADVLATAARSNLHMMRNVLAHNSGTQACSMHGDAANHPLRDYINQAHSRYDEAHRYFTARRRSALPIITGPALQDSPSLFNQAQRHAADFARSTAERATHVITDDDRAEILLVYEHQSAVRAHLVDEPFANGYPPSAAAQFVEDITEQIMPRLTPADRVAFNNPVRNIRNRVQLLTHDIPRESPAAILHDLRQYGLSASSYHQAQSVFADHPASRQRLDQSIREASPITDQQVQHVLDAAIASAIPPAYLAHLVSSLDRDPQDYDLQSGPLAPTNAMHVMRRAFTAGLHIQPAFRLARAILPDPDDAIHLLDVTGYHTTGFTPQ